LRRVIRNTSELRIFLSTCCPSRHSAGRGVGGCQTFAHRRGLAWPSGPVTPRTHKQLRQAAQQSSDAKGGASLGSRGIRGCRLGRMCTCVTPAMAIAQIKPSAIPSIECGQSRLRDHDPPAPRAAVFAKFEYRANHESTADDTLSKAVWVSNRRSAPCAVGLTDC
jgi:hypothetical protein